MPARSTSIAFALLFLAAGCDSELDDSAEFRSHASPGKGMGKAKGKGHKKCKTLGNGKAHPVHNNCPQELDISDLLADYDEATNPYSDPQMWLSGPDSVDDFVLSVNLDTTIVYPDLSTEVIRPKRAVNPDLDIFFIHGTVNLDFEPGNDDLSDLTNTKLFTIETAARFSTIGRVIAPLYRSATAGVFLPGGEVDRDAYFEVAYADVEDAFTHYLVNHWDGRKLAIMGVSQGGAMTRMLFQRFIADHPNLMSRMVAVLPMSADVQIDSFDFLPPCEGTEQTGCYITYNAYLEDHEPQEGAGFADWIGFEPVCINIAGAGSEPGIFAMSYFSLPQAAGQLPSDALNDIPISIDTPFMAFPGFYAADCVNDERSYLEVRHANPEDQRWTPIDYAHPFNSADQPLGLGLHLFDYGLGMGDMLALVAHKASRLDDESGFYVTK